MVFIGSALLNPKTRGPKTELGAISRLMPAWSATSTGSQAKAPAPRPAGWGKRSGRGGLLGDTHRVAHDALQVPRDQQQSNVERAISRCNHQLGELFVKVL